jgi:hypothetical protein
LTLVEGGTPIARIYIATGAPSDERDADHELLVAKSPRGVHLGVNNLRQTLGCGWHAPGTIGEHNLLAVRVSAGGLAELGAGGIRMSVMIYATPSQ